LFSLSRFSPRVDLQQSRALLDDWTSELKRLDRDLSKSSSSAHRREQPSGYAPVITRELPPTRNTVQVHAAPALSPQEARIERETREQQERSKAEAAGAVPAHQKAMTDLLNGTSQGEGKSKPQSADADANANAAKQAELVELQQQLEQVRVSKKLMASVPSSAAMSAAQLKDRGNEALKANELLDASICYTRSLLIDHFSTAAAIVYANRGLAFHRSKNFEAAENEFSSALQCDPNYVKVCLLLSASAFQSRALYLISFNSQAMSRRSVTRLARGRFALGLQGNY
jgi:tetratricopeptide (TPR) repeat protein